MTTLQKSLVAAALIAAGVTTTLLVQLPTQSKLRAENQALRRLQVEQAEQFAAETARLSNQLARTRSLAPPSNGPSAEVLKLRGEVGRLRQERAAAAAFAKLGPSALSGLTATPEMRNAYRLEQKAIMGTVYKDFAKSLNLPKDQAEKLMELLADNRMASADHVTAALRDGQSGEEMKRWFAGQEAALREQVLAMLGPDGFSQYQDYTRNLVSKYSSEEFKEMLTGDDATREAQSRQLSHLVREETQKVLANAGLSSDYQTIPMLNFHSIASAEEAEKNLKLLENIYERVEARAGSFLSAEELAKFAEYRAAVILASRGKLMMNRKMMSPGSN